MGRAQFNLDLIVEDLLPDHALAVVKERRLLKDHFVEYAAKSPYVSLLATHVIRKELRSHVAVSATMYHAVPTKVDRRCFNSSMF